MFIEYDDDYKNIEDFDMEPEYFSSIKKCMIFIRERLFAYVEFSGDLFDIYEKDPSKVKEMIDKLKTFDDAYSFLYENYYGNYRYKLGFVIWKPDGTEYEYNEK